MVFMIKHHEHDPRSSDKAVQNRENLAFYQFPIRRKFKLKSNLPSLNIPCAGLLFAANYENSFVNVL